MLTGGLSSTAGMVALAGGWDEAVFPLDSVNFFECDDPTIVYALETISS